MAEDELCQDAARGGTCDDGTDGRLDPAPSIPFSDHDVDNHDQYRAGQYMYPPSKSAALLAVVKTVAYTNVCSTPASPVKERAVRVPASFTTLKELNSEFNGAFTCRSLKPEHFSG
jgi:hypothetical protein